MTYEHFLAIYRELIEENPFAVRAVLRILEVSFDRRIPTLAVTCEERPRFLVNPDFLTKHCKTDAHIKAVIAHEFLHVLLLHTDTAAPISRARHIAFDAVINAIICRTQGEEWASFFSAYYAKAEGVERLLRPPITSERLKCSRSLSDDQLGRAWLGLYDGILVADDIAELAEEMARDVDGVQSSSPISSAGQKYGDLIGNHAGLEKQLSPQVTAALEQAMRQMTGEGIWRDQPRGFGHRQALAALEKAAENPVKLWEKATLMILRRHVCPDARSRSTAVEAHQAELPVLSSEDRRSFLRSLWDPILPNSRWNLSRSQKQPTAQVYLDVSGSMSSEMSSLIALLARLSSHIRRPFWAFSDAVVPATIKDGRLVTSTTGGTSMACVLEHVIETRPRAAVVITDGYIEKLDPRLVAAAKSAAKLHILISRHGSPAALSKAGIPYTQLQSYPS